MSGAAFFDLDKTLIPVNSASLYVRWRVRQGRLGMADVARASWWKLQYTFGLLDFERVSRYALRSVAGRDEADYRAECAGWVRDELVGHVSAAARSEVDRQRAAGRVCALLTSTSPYLADPIAEDLGVEHVLATQLTVERGSFTGEIEPPLCYGHGKVERARAWAAIHDVSLAESSFFTDSVSDLPMLEAVGEPRVINPDPRLSRVARQRGWPVARWV